MFKVDENIMKYLDEITNIRRDLHRIPEAGFEELKTAGYIQAYLEGLNLDKVERMAGTGVVGLLKGSNDNKTIAFRSDIDGLSVSEETAHDFKSDHEGFMHACGHDGHMSILLVYAKYLSENRSSLKENVLFIFQPAEEGPGGAEVMINEGLMEKYAVDEVYGLHLYPEVLENRFSLRKGPMMAMTGEFDIDITGKSGHGAMPHKAVDSAVLASELLLGFQKIVSRHISPIDPAVLTVGRMEVGERRNVIAGTARMEGTMRAFKEEVYNHMKADMIRLMKGMEVSYDCNIQWEFRDMYPPVVNDDQLVEDFIEANGAENVDIIEPQMISEDFSYFQKEVPGVFFFLGVKSDEKGYVFPLHHSKFNFDERMLLNGVQSYVNLMQHKGMLSLS